jgi:hypothetical protein
MFSSKFVFDVLHSQSEAHRADARSRDRSFDSARIEESYIRADECQTLINLFRRTEESGAAMPLGNPADRAAVPPRTETVTRKERREASKTIVEARIEEAAKLIIEAADNCDLGAITPVELISYTAARLAALGITKLDAAKGVEGP